MSGIRAGRPARRPPAAAAGGRGGAGPASGPAAPAPHVGRGRGGAGRGSEEAWLRRGGVLAAGEAAGRRVCGRRPPLGFWLRVVSAWGVFFLFFFFPFNALFTSVQRLCRLPTQFSNCDSVDYTGLGSALSVQGNIWGRGKGWLQWK